MLKLNKYLKEVGIDENFWLFKDAKSGDERFFPDEDGFIEAEFWNLNDTLAMCIYSYLCYFKEHCNYCHPSYMTAEKWDKCLDDMIVGFKLLIDPKNEESFDSIESKNRKKKINYGLRLFIKHLGALWF